jgi:hypothetical protein
VLTKARNALRTVQSGKLKGASLDTFENLALISLPGAINAAPNDEPTRTDATVKVLNLYLTKLEITFHS